MNIEPTTHKKARTDTHVVTDLPSQLTTPFPTARSSSSSIPFSQYLTKTDHGQKAPTLTEKKLSVHILKVSEPELTAEYVNEAWARLKNATLPIQTNGAVSESAESLYQLCETLCQYDKAHSLYENLYRLLDNHVENQLVSLASSSAGDIAICETVYSLWTKYTQEIVQVRCIFLYLDRVYFAHNTQYGSIWNMAVDIFKSNLQKCNVIWESMLTGILGLIRQQRSGEPVDEGILQRSIRILIDLNLYHTSFEKYLLDATRKFYDEEGSHLLQTMNIFDYLNHVANRLHQETTIRIKSYLDRSTKSSIQSIVGNELLIRRATAILEKSFNYFLQLDSIEDSDYGRLSLLYRLLQKVDRIDICAKYFTMYVKQKGSRILRSNNGSAMQKIMNLSQFESQVDELVDHSFEGDELFVEGLKDGIEYFSNLKENNVIRTLTRYIDQIMRSSMGAFDQKLLDKGMFLFQNIRAKDEFEVIYKRDLAKRLLLKDSNLYAEKLMLAKIKAECGAGYTGKMEGMVRDIEKSAELMEEFTSSNESYKLIPALNVNLLTYGFWPSYTPIAINLPPVFQELQSTYNAFYTKKFERRVLTWQNTLSACEVLGHYPKGSKQLTLTLQQTVVLLLFNDVNKAFYTFEEILSYTQIDEVELRRTLLSLSCRDNNLLIKEPSTNDIRPTDQFRFNEAFTSDKQQLTLTTATLNEVIEKNSSLNTTILFAREQQIDAVIVRVMKSKGTLAHGLLLNEISNCLKFTATAQEIKGRIELLIEKEYLERGENDTYIYQP